MHGKQQNDNARQSEPVSKFENEILENLTAAPKDQKTSDKVFPADFSASGTGKGGGGSSASIEQ